MNDLNILIVDDEQIILKWLKKNIEELSPEYHVVSTCINGEQAFKICLENKIDMLFSDIRMPIMDGMELLKHLSDNNIHPYTVMLSAYDDFSYVRDSFKLGASEYLLKPEITKKGLSDCIDLAKQRISLNTLHTEDYQNQSDLDKFIDKFFQNPCDEAARQLKDMLVSNNQFKNQLRIVLVSFPIKTVNIEKIKDVIDFTYQEENIIYKTTFKNDENIFIFSEAPNIEIEKFARKVSESFNTFGLKNISIVYSNQFNKSSDLLKVYQGIMDAAKWHKFYNLYVTSNQYTLKVLEDKSNIRLTQTYNNLQNLLRNRKWQEIKIKMPGFWMEINDIKPSIMSLRSFLLNFILNIYWNYIDEKYRSEFSIDNMIDICDLDSFKEITAAYQQQLDKLLKILVDENLTRSYSEAVDHGVLT